MSVIALWRSTSRGSGIIQSSERRIVFPIRANNALDVQVLILSVKGDQAFAVLTLAKVHRTTPIEGSAARCYVGPEMSLEGFITNFTAKKMIK